MWPFAKVNSRPKQCSEVEIMQFRYLRDPEVNDFLNLTVGLRSLPKDKSLTKFSLSFFVKLLTDKRTNKMHQ